MRSVDELDHAEGHATEAVASDADIADTESHEPESRHSGHTWKIVVMAIITVSAIGLAIAYFATRPTWDERIEPLANQVARLRALEFEQPVRVEFITPDEFDAQVTDDTELDEEERADLDRTVALFRAVGLMQGDIDLHEASNALASSAVLAYYDSEDEVIRVSGTELDASAQVTLVHELTHALQDQHFDLDAMREDAHTPETNLALTALLEGDAMTVQERYRATLPADDLDDSIESNNEALEQLEAADVPDVLAAAMAFPYQFGPVFVMDLIAAGGYPAVNDAFADPPASDQHILYPVTYTTREIIIDVDDPQLADGETEFDRGEFGPLGLLLMLSERIDAGEAERAVAGWGGDSYVEFERDGTVCVTTAIKGDTDADTDRLAQALRAWSNAMPAGASTVATSGGVVTFSSCDPGAEAVTNVTGASTDALTMMALRNTFEAQLAGSGVGRDPARCVATKVVANYGIEDLTGAAVPDGFQQQLAAWAQSCGAF